MTQMIFVNLPVTDLERSKAFYAAVGFRNEPKFTDETAAMMQLTEAVNVMLLTHGKWSQFTDRTIPDLRREAQVALCLTRDSRDAVDATVATATGAGGKADPNPQQDYGWMYGRSFEDPDGHIWELVWMDVAAAEQAGAELADA